MNLELNGENNRSKRDAYSKVTRETRATARADLKFHYGEAAPWFNEIGGAIQIKSSKGFHSMIDQIRVIEKWVFENGKWKELKLIDGIWK